MGPFERRTTPPPPATTERTSWIPAAPERQSWLPPPPAQTTERQSWAPPPPLERQSWTPPPQLDRPPVFATPIPDLSNNSSLSSDRTSPIPGSDNRSLRTSRPPAGTRSSGFMTAVTERAGHGQTGGSGFMTAVTERAGHGQTERWYLELPLRPGEGPFQIKGLAHRGLLQYVQQRVAGGPRAFLTALPTDLLRDFFGQPFLASSFYDLLPLATGSAIIADMTRTPLEVFAQQQGRSQALHDIQHAYRALLQGRTADDFHLRLRPLASRYYNFGEWDVLRDEPHRLRILSRGIPMWIMPWFSPMQVGYFTGLIAAMGKPHSTVTATAVKREGTAAGLPLASLELEIHLRD